MTTSHALPAEQVDQALLPEQLSALLPPPSDRLTVEGATVPWYSAEFWTSRQRQVSSLHEISYRACFKAQLPRFFISALTREGDVVYDPFSGRGTTALEAALLGRNVIANDINPLSTILTRPRLTPPDLGELHSRLQKIRPLKNNASDPNLGMFFHRETLAEILGLRGYLIRRRRQGTEDDLDRWIRMVATNRLTGHSKGFFSVYTLPPNQAVSRERQKQINRKLRQRPEYRGTRELIYRKSRSLLRNVRPEEMQRLHAASIQATLLTADARSTPAIRSESIHLTVTSPPFLNIVNYSADNWLRCWFNALDPRRIAKSMSVSGSLEDWSQDMHEVFSELYRITRRGGWVAFEVGEIHKGRLELDRVVAGIGQQAGLACVGVITNTQQFTKTSNIWGISNNRRGTNSNRIVLFRKD